MSQTKAQLVGGVGISTVGNLSVYGGLNATGVITATSFSGDGSTLSGISSVSFATTSYVLAGTPNISVGVATASSFVGPLTGTATGLTGTPNITVGFITATGASISGSVTVGGNVSIAGTLTYEDVTNVDSVGLVTARAGVNVTGGSVVISSGGLTVSGVTTVAAGSTSAPSLSPTGDNNTGIFFPSADTIAFAEGGAEVARFDSSGRFGVGTASPSNTLEVNGNIRSYTAAAGDVSITHSGLVSSIIAAGSISLALGANSSERVRISTTGGFSVGTTANPGTGAIYATGDITAFYSSDIRLKKDIEPISEPIKKLMEISGVTYKWNEEYLKDKDVDGYFVRETEVGVIAQEVEKVLPEVVATRENGYKAVRYEKLVALLIEAVKDQQHQIDELKTRLKEV